MIYTKQSLLDPPPAERTAAVRGEAGFDSPVAQWLAQAAAAEAAEPDTAGPVGGPER
jgi:hypothetical protein